MPMFKRTLELGLYARRTLIIQLTQMPMIPNQVVVRNLHKLLPTNCRPVQLRSIFGQSNLSAICFPSRNIVGQSPSLFHSYYRMLMSSSIKERIYDNLILFTRMLHKQSNVYICLRFRRLGQICNLYRRIYSPRDFKNLLVDRLLDRLRHFGLLLRNRSSYLQNNFKNYRHRILLSFASVGIFSWDENRITDQELQELMKEFISIDNNCNIKSTENQNESYCKPDSTSDLKSVAKSQAEGNSFMVVNCLQATQKSAEKWEEVINQPNFHVWRKSVNNTSLYEYKGISFLSIFFFDL